MVAPYSGDMFAIVARSANPKASSPSPKNSTNRPTTPCLRNIWVTISTRSVAVAPSGKRPVSFIPTTSGSCMKYGCPNITASASMPPTPQPITPTPLIIVVWESVPTSVSGYAIASPLRRSSRTTLARYSRFTWWTMPVPGGTTVKLSNACCAHLSRA